MLIKTKNKNKGRAVEDTVIIKKYANRRLYNTETSIYITLEDLANMVKDNRNFEVVDAKTGADITHQVLAQIIFEEETKGAAMLPISFLKQIIKFYDHHLNSVLPSYLDMTMDVFNKNQDRWREKAEQFGTFGNPFGNITELQRQNIEIMKKSLSMFNPFLATGSTDGKDQQISDLTNKIDELNQEIARLKKLEK